MNYITIIDKDKKLLSRIYFNLDDMTIYGVTYKHNKAMPTNKDYIASIIDCFKSNKNISSIYSNAKINNKKDLKDFIKQNNKSIVNFIKNNFTSTIMYDEHVDYEKKLEEIKKQYQQKFNIAMGIVAVGTASFLIALSAMSFSNTTIIDTSKTEEFEYAENQQEQDIPDEITDEDIINYLNTSSFMESDVVSDDVKNTVINESFFDAVLPYINDNDLSKEIIYEAMNNLSIESNELESKAGIYKPSNYKIVIDPNYINDSRVLDHEFIHAYQRVDFLSYLIESTCELSAAEFYNSDYGSYNKAIENLKILMEIVGPEIVWRYNFSYDDELLELLKNNLSSEDYDTLYNIFKKECCNCTYEEHQKVEQILYNLAMNYLNEEEHELFVNKLYYSILDYNGYDENGNEVKYYFNADRMDDKETIIIGHKTQAYVLKDKETGKEISVSTYLYRNYSKEEKDKYEVISSPVNSQPDVEKYEVDSYKNSFKTLDSENTLSK